MGKSDVLDELQPQPRWNRVGLAVDCSIISRNIKYVIYIYIYVSTKWIVQRTRFTCKNLPIISNASRRSNTNVLCRCRRVTNTGDWTSPLFWLWCECARLVRPQIDRHNFKRNDSVYIFSGNDSPYRLRYTYCKSFDPPRPNMKIFRTLRNFPISRRSNSVLTNFRWHSCSELMGVPSCW